jgi:hypothetical protein
MTANLEDNKKGSYSSEAGCLEGSEFGPISI